MGMKKSNMLGMLAMMAAMSNPEDYGTFIEEKPIKKPKKEIVPKGLKEFFYGENSLYALNQKNADRKARKKGYL